MTKMSKKDRAEGEAIAVDIRRRPAFQAACVWLERARRTYGDAVTGKQVVANIRTLGFDPRAVKILLNSHQHFDHAAGLASQFLGGDDLA